MPAVGHPLNGKVERRSPPTKGAHGSARHDPAGLSGPGRREQMEALRPIGRNDGAYQHMLDGPDRAAARRPTTSATGASPTSSTTGTPRGMEISPAPLLLNVYLGHVHEAPQARPARPRRCRPTTRSASPRRSRSPTTCSRDACSSGWRAATRPAGRTSSASASASPRPRRTSRAPTSGTACCSSEHFKIMKMAWANDLLSYDGPDLRGAVPVRRGHPELAAGQSITIPYGVPGEVDANGTVVGSASCRSPTRARTRSCSRLSAPARARC